MEFMRIRILYARHCIKLVKMCNNYGLQQNESVSNLVNDLKPRKMLLNNSDNQNKQNFMYKNSGNKNESSGNRNYILANRLTETWNTYKLTSFQYMVEEQFKVVSCFRNVT
jgi:hypothetical protein